MATITGTIQAGQSLSDPIDCSAGTIQHIAVPPDWTGALLSFQASSDNISYFDMFRSNNIEMAVNVTPGTVFLLPADFPVAAKTWLKLRSGTRNFPVPQEAQQQFLIEVV